MAFSTNLKFKIMKALDFQNLDQTILNVVNDNINYIGNQTVEDYIISNCENTDDWSLYIEDESQREAFEDYLSEFYDYCPNKDRFSIVFHDDNSSDTIDNKFASLQDAKDELESLRSNDWFEPYLNNNGSVEIYDNHREESILSKDLKDLI